MDYIGGKQLNRALMYAYCFEWEAITFGKNN